MTTSAATARRYEASAELEVQVKADVTFQTMVQRGMIKDSALQASAEDGVAAKIKAAPGKLNYASVTGANDLLFAAFLKTEKLEMAKVPYKDPVTAIRSFISGRSSIASMAS